MYKIKDKELENFIKLAEEENCYFITVTRLESDNDGYLPHHYILTKEFPESALMPTIEHIKNNVQDEFIDGVIKKLFKFYYNCLCMNLRIKN